MADLVNVPQRPKAESYNENLFLITRLANILPELVLDSEQISVFLGKNYVLSFQERHGDVFYAACARACMPPKVPIRHQGADYLAYAILDIVIDTYYPVLEKLGDYFADLEDEVLESASRSTLKNANRTRNILLALRRTIWPQREAINALLRDDGFNHQRYCEAIPEGLPGSLHTDCRSDRILS